MKKYILNQETQKIELHFDKSEYMALTDEQKKEIKSAYLFSRKSQAWVSRSTNNHYNAVRVAKNLGFTDGGSIGERLSYAEEVERAAEKAENRAARYEQYSGHAAKRAENLQSGLNKMHGDIAFFTQPNINTSSGRAFTNYREKLFNRYNKGIDEYRKSSYFKEKAAIAADTASMTKFKDRTYLYNRIEECNKTIKGYEKNIAYYEGNNNDDKLQYWIEKMEYEVDKLAFLKNCLDEIGGIVYSQENIKAGYLVKIRGSWETVLKANRTTVETQPIEENLKMCIGQRPYAEIQDMKVTESSKKPKEEIKNPYIIGDLLVHYSCGGNCIIKAYQVLKTTAKGVQLQQVNIIDNKPVKDDFTVNKPIRRMIRKSEFDGCIRCYDDDWELNKYIG